MKLSDYLSRHDIGDSDFAKSVGIDRSSVNRMRNGKLIPSADVLRRIAEATAGAVMPNDFFDLNDTALPAPEAGADTAAAA